MIFSFDGNVMFDGDFPEIGTDLMNLLHGFIWKMPDKYLNEFMPRLISDFTNRESYLYTPQDQFEEGKYWFETLGADMSIKDDEDLWSTSC